MAKIISLNDQSITFDNGHIIYSDHDTSCCEWHEIHTSDIELDEVKDMEFDLSLPFEELIEKVEGYGIRIKSTNSHPLSIPAYGYNNGYYGDNITLYLSKDNITIWSEDISECQEWKY